jgi:hypothetical protein
MSKIVRRGVLLALAFALTGCGAAYYGAVVAIFATQKKTTTTLTSFPDAVPTDDKIPAFGTMIFSTDKVTVTRDTNAPGGGGDLTDFQVTGVDFPSGFGQAISNRDASGTLAAIDKLVVRINGDTSREITFDTSDVPPAVAPVGTAAVVRIVAKVQALTTSDPNKVPQDAYKLFSGSFDPTTNAYTFVSGVPGPNSEVAWQPDPRPDIAGDVKPDDQSNKTAQKLGSASPTAGSRRRAPRRSRSPCSTEART